jgi:hypothetical protein
VQVVTEYHRRRGKEEIVMNGSRLKNFGMLGLSVLLVISWSACQERQPAQTMDEYAEGAGRLDGWETEQAVRTLEGELIWIDPQEEVLMVAADDGREVEFVYDGWTEIVGADEGVHGITGSGTRVEVEYEMGFPTNRAKRIEILRQNPAE